MIWCTRAPIDNNNLITRPQGGAPPWQRGLQKGGAVLTGGNDRDAYSIARPPSPPRPLRGHSRSKGIGRRHASGDRRGRGKGVRKRGPRWPVLLRFFTLGDAGEVTSESVCGGVWRGRVSAEEEAEEEEEGGEEGEEEEGEEAEDWEMGETGGMLKGEATVDDEFAGGFVGTEDAVDAGADEVDEGRERGGGWWRGGRERDEDRGGGERGGETGGTADMGYGL